MKLPSGIPNLIWQGEKVLSNGRLGWEGKKMETYIKMGWVWAASLVYAMGYFIGAGACIS